MIVRDAFGELAANQPGVRFFAFGKVVVGRIGAHQVNAPTAHKFGVPDLGLLRLGMRRPSFGRFGGNGQLIFGVMLRIAGANDLYFAVDEQMRPRGRKSFLHELKLVGDVENFVLVCARAEAQSNPPASDVARTGYNSLSEIP